MYTCARTLPSECVCAFARCCDMVNETAVAGVSCVAALQGHQLQVDWLSSTCALALSHTLTCCTLLLSLLSCVCQTASDLLTHTVTPSHKHTIHLHRTHMPTLCRDSLLSDYAVDIFCEAAHKKQYDCFLRADTRLPMMYLSDCLRATMQFLEAPPEQLKQRTYNVTGMSFTPEEIVEEMKRFYPDLEVSYHPDSRQNIGKRGRRGEGKKRGWEEKEGRARLGWGLRQEQALLDWIVTVFSCG